MDDVEQSVLLTNFTCKKRRFKVFFHQLKIIWDTEKPPFHQVTVPIQNVIAVKQNFLPVSHPLDDPSIDPNNFTIHYAEKGRNKTWEYKSITFRHSDPIQVVSWVKTLQNHLETFTNRPKKMLLFVNPFGGKRSAMQIYEKEAKPLFILANIDVTVNVSQRKDQIKDFVTYHNLDMFDSVACVGGDGTVSELFNGLVIRECRMKGIDMNDHSQALPKPSLPVGIIPGGSTDTIAYCLHGTKDTQTAVLHIIFGDTLGLDLVSVYDTTRLLRLYASVLSYGYLGDVAYHSDRHRWMGPRRYEYSGLKKILMNKGYKGEIAVLSVESGSEGEEGSSSKCFESCSTCLESSCDDVSIKKDGCNWKTLNGKYFMVSGANISCACDRSPNGIAPFCHVGDGHLYLVLVHHTSLLNILRLLLRMSSKRGKIDDLPFIEMHKGKEFRFKSLEGHSRWNCDGEVESETDIHAIVRCQLLSVYSRGNPIPADDETTKCCGLCKN
ncbi:ceramide kinase isoform X2 [Onthophagus taurus]|uniref:ceramide kinase isoform X2 n=1 Tax=Onthophagus taurus TaxID=166361 RepID=UPI000C20173C|nr:ceramide kinase [Onthophagus taurus]XP_022915133.1 ceramide kinase [Onthophagus taurus]